MRGPTECPECGHDPTGDDASFQAGGGWIFDNEVSGGYFSDIFRCPVCNEEVHRDTHKLDEGRRI